MIEFIPALALLALVKKLVDLLRYARGGDVNAVVTQVVAWAGAVAVVVLSAQTDYAAGIEVGGLTLDALNAWSLIFVGLTIGSAASLVEDTLKAVDNTRTGAKPGLIEEVPS